MQDMVLHLRTLGANRVAPVAREMTTCLRDVLFFEVGELFLQSGHLIQTLHPSPLAVLVVHLCLGTSFKCFTRVF